MLECAAFAAAMVMHYVYEQAQPSDHNHNQALAVVRVYTEPTAEVVQYCPFWLATSLQYQANLPRCTGGLYKQTAVQRPRVTQLMHKE